jgi:hypothetical protein
MRQRGRLIYSNTPLVDLRVKFVQQGPVFCSHSGLRISYPAWIPVDNATFGVDWAEGYVFKFEELYDLDNCEVLLDELASWMPSHKHSQIPDEVRRFLAQDRREGVNTWWTHRTTRVFHEVLENTADLVRCSRYGPVIHLKSVDPEDKSGKAVHKFMSVQPQIYDLYQTFARVGAANGEGYGLGKRKGYQASGALIKLHDYGPHGHDLFVRRPHLVCLIRKFGPSFVGLQREDAAAFGSSRPRYFLAGVS